MSEGFGGGSIGLSVAEGSASVFALSLNTVLSPSAAGSSFFGESGLRRPTGFNCMSLIGEDGRLLLKASPGEPCSGLLLPMSMLPRCCLMRLISAIQAGCAGGGGCFNLGESGLLRALSSQLDFVGLQRLEGLGGEVSSCGWSFSLKVDATDLLRLWLWAGSAGLTNSRGARSSSRVPGRVTVALLWLEVGRDEGSMELSLLSVGLSALDSEPYPAIALPRLLIVEFCLVKPGGVAVLQRLLTLSLRLSMALCTKPPMPLVGEVERSRSGEILPCVGDMAIPRVARELSASSGMEPASDGGANFCESSRGRAEPLFVTGSTSPADMEVLVEKRLLSTVLSRAEPPREPGELERALSGGGLLTSGSRVESRSRDMPGSARLPVPVMEPASDALSSWLFLYAAEPAPRSAVWRK